MDTPHDNDLQWQAFQYVTGEMPLDECERFEQRLAEDQQAREAVARAVQLGEAVVSLEASRPSKVGQTTSRRPFALLAVIASVAACLAIAIGVHYGNRQQSETTVAADEAGASELVELWASSQLDWDQSKTTFAVLDSEDGEFPGSEQQDDFSGGEFVVPSWMLEALSPEDPKPEEG